jgi:hypothetical protein
MSSKYNRREVLKKIALGIKLKAVSFWPLPSLS